MRDNHDGFTLVELIIAIGLMVLVIGLLGAFMINSMTTQQAVRSQTQAASQGQLVARTVKAGVANASGLKLTELTTGATAGGQLLVVRTLGAGSSPQWACEAWYFSGDGGAVYTTRSPAAIAAPTTTSPSWTLLVDDVSARPSGSGIFSATATTATVDFTVAAARGSGVQITTSATIRNQEGVNAPCF